MNDQKEPLTTIAPCLADGPLASGGLRCIASMDALGSSGAATGFRAHAVYRAFLAFEEIQRSGVDPYPAFAAVLELLADSADAAHAAGVLDFGVRVDAEPQGSDDEIRERTGNHYGRLFAAFDPDSYFKEPTQLLEERLVRNGLAADAWQGKSVVDLGCGGGRYSVAWKLLGAGSVLGVDGSQLGVGDAQERVKIAGIDEVTFQVADVLDTGLESDSFDIVFSNGVLHHTVDWERGIRETLRVLRPGGWGWLYVIEDPGGLFWDFIEVFRAVTRHDSSAQSRAALMASGVAPNRVFYTLDHVMAPINVRATPEAVSAALKGAGATEVRRLERGADFDRVEAIHRGDAHAKDLFGAGENRFVFSK